MEFSISLETLFKTGTISQVYLLLQWSSNKQNFKQTFLIYRSLICLTDLMEPDDIAVTCYSISMYLTDEISVTNCNRERSIHN